MRRKIFSLLKNSNALRTLSIEESYFKTFSFVKKRKISKEIVAINYGEYSPYTNLNTLHKQLEDEVLVWYAAKKSLERGFTIPEAYLLYKYFLKNSSDGIFIFNREPETVIVIKDGKLKSQLTKENISNLSLKLLQKEYQLDKIYNYSNREYHEFIEKGVELLSFADWQDFLELDIDKKTFLERSVDTLAYPVVALVVLLFLLEVGNYLYLDKELALIKKEYKEVRLKTGALRDKKLTIEEEAEKYTPLHRELENNREIFSALDKLSTVVEENNGTFGFLKIAESSIDVKVESNRTLSIFSQIVDSAIVEKLKIVSIQKLRFSDKERAIFKGVRE